MFLPDIVLRHIKHAGNFFQRIGFDIMIIKNSLRQQVHIFDAFLKISKHFGVFRSNFFVVAGKLFLFVALPVKFPERYVITDFIQP